jgi:type I restriction enzyme R subunit
MHQRKSKRSSKQRNASPNTSEFLTRKQIIDSKLRAAGWTISPFKLDRALSAYKNCAIEEYPTESGPADYALCVDGQILGVVEAKKLTLGPQEVLPQAERYSRGVSASPFDFNGFRVPFLYSTNGEVIWHHDVRHPLNRSHQIAAFHTPDALREFLGRNIESALDRLVRRPNDHPRLRPYQRGGSLDGLLVKLNEAIAT